MWQHRATTGSAGDGHTMHQSSIYFFSVDPEKAFADIIGTEPIGLEAHRLMEVVPASHLIQNLAKPYINLNHHVLGPKSVKDIVSAMVSNTTITQLECEDSCILVEGAICIGEMFINQCLSNTPLFTTWLVASKTLGGNIARTTDPISAKGYSIPYDISSAIRAKRKAGSKGKGGWESAAHLLL
uniref:Uncharacterized protein n=1 Tax=Junco hyemalis TaxID=40217 RepID=A0A8C5J834_JUNHY